MLEPVYFGSILTPIENLACALSRSLSYSAHIEDMYAKNITKAFQKHFVTDTQALG